MKKLANRHQKSMSTLLGVAVMLSILLTIGSFMITYWNSETAPKATSDQCRGASVSKSADGLVVMDEADLSCSGKDSKNQSLSESIQIASILAGSAGVLLTIVLVYIILKSQRH